MTDVVLYDYWRSTASWRVRIALNLADLSYSSVPVDLVAGDQGEDAHVARNPQALVPVLEIDGLRLTQSMAILDYLEDTGDCRCGPRIRLRRRACAPYFRPSPAKCTRCATCEWRPMPQG